MRNVIWKNKKKKDTAITHNYVRNWNNSHPVESGSVWGKVGVAGHAEDVVGAHDEIGGGGGIAQHGQGHWVRVVRRLGAGTGLLISKVVDKSLFNFPHQ